MWYNWFVVSLFVAWYVFELECVYFNVDSLKGDYKLPEKVVIAKSVNLFNKEVDMVLSLLWL